MVDQVHFSRVYLYLRGEAVDGVGLPGEGVLCHGGRRRVVPAVAARHGGREAGAGLVRLPILGEVGHPEVRQDLKKVSKKTPANHQC